MSRDELIKKYRTTQPFHNLVNTLAQWLADGIVSLDDIEGAAALAEEKRDEILAARALNQESK